MEIRSLYYNTVKRIYNNRLSFESLYSVIFEELENNEKKKLVNLVNTFFRNFNFVEYVLINKVDKNIEKQEMKTLMLLLCAGVEYLYFDKSVDYGIVNDYVEIAKTELGLNKSKYVNAILRKLTVLDRKITEEEKLKSLYLSTPEWIITKLKNIYGGKVTRDILEFNQTVPGMYIRVNRTKENIDKLIELFKEEEIEAEKINGFDDFLKIVKGNPLNSKYFGEGCFYIQDPSSALPVLLLSPKKNEKILDLCCAPGGKSTYIQEITGDKSKLYINDLSKKKRVIIKNNFKRLGLSFSKLTSVEAEKFTSFEEFDKILLDVPCSGSGNFRRHPESRWNKEEEMLLELTKLQTKILDNSKIYVKKGGVIVYSTCSIFDDENIDIVNKFILANPDYEIEDDKNFENYKYSKGGYMINPAIHGYEGSFCVKIKRVK